MSTTMTEGELIAALLAYQETDQGGDENALTIAEIVDRVGLPEPHVRKAIRAMAKDGRVECFRDWRPTLAGHRQRYPVYRVKEVA